jgi:multiple sugar transport system substrate-binding protein
MDAAYLADYAGHHQLADLTTGIHIEDMDAVLVNSGKYKGTLYAIALGNNAYGMAYNRDAIEKLGITMPRHDWTWEDYLNMGEEAKAKLSKNQYALMDNTPALDIYGIYQLSQGKGYYVTDDGKFNIDKEIWLEWQKTHARLRKEGIVPPPEVTVIDKELDPNLDLMVNGTVLIRPMHAAQSTALYSLKPEAMAMVTMPRNTAASGWLKPSMFWSISAGSPYIEESKKFIDWFIHNKEAADILGTSRGVPVSSEVLSYLEPKFKAADKMGIELINQTAPDAQDFHPDPMGWMNFRRKDYKSITEKLMYEQSTPEEAYEEMVKRAKVYESNLITHD